MMKTKSKMLWGLATAVIAAAALMGCVPETMQSTGQRPAARAADPECTGPLCPAQPHEVRAVKNAIDAPLDPTRESILQETRTQRTDQMLDHTYLTASGIGLNQRPDSWGDELADRRTHEACLAAEWDRLWAGTAPEADENTIKGTRHERAIALDECFAQGRGEWATASTATRATWISRILQAARRATSPSDAMKPYVRKEREDREWLRLAETFEACIGPMMATADLIALTAGGEETAEATLQGIGDTVTCNERAADLAYPQELTGPGSDGYGSPPGYEGPAGPP